MTAQAGHDAEPVSWRETYVGGSPESEEAFFAGLAEEMVAIQRGNAASSGARMRTLHAKTVVGVLDARLEFLAELPVRGGPYRENAGFDVAVRLSNASGLVRSDTEADLRGAALKVRLPGGGEHDLLMTNYPVSHARDARQFVTAARIGSGSRALAIPRMIRAFGLSEALRVVGNVRRAARVTDSLAAESYWSRGAVLWDAAGPVRFRLSPAAAVQPRPDVPAADPDRLRLDFAARLREGPVRFELALQRFVDERQTPLEDGAVPWETPWLPVATLTVGARDLLGAEGERQRAAIEATVFNPWHAPAEFRPLGGLNRARKAVYEASARAWR